MFDLERFENLWTNPSAIKLFTLLAALLFISILIGFVRRGLNRTIKDTDRKYRARKAISFVGYFFMILAVLFVYSDRLGNIGIALGVAGAGVAFALQEVIVAFAGWLTIMIGGAISVGQRVRIGDVKGDVIDIGVLRTTIMEIGDWVNGDLYNGRIVTFSNGFIYKEKVHNYSAEYPFLWDEIRVPIRTSSDYRFARELFYKVLEEVCGDYTRDSEEQWKKLANNYRVEQARVEPMVTLTFDENWITFTLRYIVDYKMRRSVKDQISTRLLDEINKHPDRIEIATTAMEVTNIREDEGAS